MIPQGLAGPPVLTPAQQPTGTLPPPMRLCVIGRGARAWHPSHPSFRKEAGRRRRPPSPPPWAACSRRPVHQTVGAPAPAGRPSVMSQLPFGSPPPLLRLVEQPPNPIGATREQPAPDRVIIAAGAPRAGAPTRSRQERLAGRSHGSGPRWKNADVVLYGKRLGAVSR